MEGDFTMNILNKKRGELSRDDIIFLIGEIVLDAREKLKRLQADDSDIAYELSQDLEEIISDFDSAGDYLDSIYDEVIPCLSK